MMPRITKLFLIHVVCCLLALDNLTAAESVIVADDKQSDNKSTIDLLTTVADYKQNLEDIETRSGAYSRELFEPLASLAQALVDADIYSEAEQIIDRGIQISRINDGLFNLHHLNLLKLAINIASRTDDWDKANDRTDYLVELYRYSYKDQPEELLQSLQAVSDWHWTVIARDDEDNRAMHLLKAHDINLRLVDIAQSQLQPNSTQLNKYLYRQALSLYYFSATMAVGGRTGTRVLTETSTLGALRPIEGLARFYPREFEYKLRQGMGLLEQIVDSYDSPDDVVSEAKVMAAIYLADWRILLKDGLNVIGKRSPLARAQSTYLQARENLIALGYAAELVEHYFETPALLPVTEFTESFEKSIELSLGIQTTTFEPIDTDSEHTKLTRLPDFIAWSESLLGVSMPTARGESLSDELADLHGDVRFRVNTSGKASRLSVLQHVPPEQSNRAELLREVQALVFRPALINRRFRNSEMMTMRYYYPLDYRFR